MMHPPLLVEEDTAANKVLTNDDLLGEILPRIHCPSCLVCAALTSKRWLRNVSSETTIRRFRSRMPSQLLGVYVSIDGFSNLKFVPLPDASRPEHAAALRHGNFSFDDMDCPLLTIWDCRNDRVLYGFSESFHVAFDPAVRAPLRCPGEDTIMLPPQPGPIVLTLCSFLMVTPHVIVSTSSTRTRQSTRRYLSYGLAPGPSTSQPWLISPSLHRRS